MDNTTDTQNGFNVLIADAGSTKIEWIAIRDDANTATRYRTIGLNALLADYATIRALFDDVKENLGTADENASIYYYGAGCATPQICDKIKDLLLDTWNAPHNFVDSDLLGAARSLLGKNKGIACILGTGSNSCLYDGENIVDNVAGLGYILDDEGSGSSLGKQLLRDAIKRVMPENLREDFNSKYPYTIGEVLDKVYKQPAANRFIASFTPFISDHRDDPYIVDLLEREFANFLSHNVARYKGADNIPVSFTGSIAYHFAPALKKVAESMGYSVGTITKDPVNGLIEYHKALL